MVPVALITGGNRGLGLETGKQLAQLGWHVILGCRDESKCRDVADEVPRAQARVIELTKPRTATALAAELANENIVLDVLVNNAGVSLRGFDARVAEKTIATNLLGTLAVTGALLPRIKDGGAVVMVSSGMGELSVLEDPARSRVRRATSRAEIETLAAEFVAGVAAGTHQRGGWPSNSYSVSKALLNAATRVLAKELAPRVRVNSVCPGWVRTDLGGPRAPRDVREGAASIVATVIEQHATGGFFRDGKPIPW
jgi:NAD(P)-dependent dehydrogenase (short-subunit alcohol dehydrogenase family)